MKFQTRLYLLVFIVAALLMACTNIYSKNEASQSSKPIKVIHHSGDVSAASLITQAQADNFTTSGKPTKRRDTPNGPVEIYDIAQDEDVARAIRDLYAQGHLTFGDVTHSNSDNNSENFFSPDIDVTPAALLLMKARQIAYYDLFRTSCKKVERSPCGIGNGSFRTVYHQYQPCTNCNLGNAPDLNTEELRGHYARVAEKTLTEDILRKGRWPHSAGLGDPVIINECGNPKQILLPYFYIGEKSGYSLEETKKILLHHACGDE